MQLCYIDLVVQVSPKLDAVLLIGGVAGGPQERALKAGVDIVTGTPGRVELSRCFRTLVVPFSRHENENGPEC